MGRILLVSFLFLTLAANAQRPLVGIKDGVWLFFQGNEVVSLPPSYYDVGNPDELDLAVFADDGKYGVVNVKGEVIVSPRYRKLEGLGFGKFGAVLSEGNEIVDLSDGTVKTAPCSSWEEIEENWIFIRLEKHKKLLNVASGQEWDLDSTYRITNYNFGYVKLGDSSRSYLYNSLGEEVRLEGGYSSFNDRYLRLKSNEQDRIVLANNQFDLPEGVTIFQDSEDYFQYSLPGKTVRLDFQGKVIWEVPYDKVWVGDAKTLIVSKDDRVGLMDLDGNLVCPLEYLNIFKFGGEFRGLTSSGVGVIDRTGKVVVPCKYRNVNKRGGMYEVQTSEGMFGVYSPKSKKMLLQPLFTRVAVSDDKVRGWLNNKLQIVLYDDNHQIVDQFTLSNAVSKYSLASGVKEIDSRLFSIGWFYEQKPVFDKEGFKVKDRLSWGIRNSQDSVIVEPKYGTPLFVPGMSFSLIPRGEAKIPRVDGGSSKVAAYTAIDVTNGRFMSGDQIISVDSSDVLTKNYMRFTSNKGSGYITPDNKINYTSYIDAEDVEFVRIAGSKLAMEGAEDSDPEGVRRYDYQIGYEEKQWVKFIDRRDEFNKIKFLEAEWNFLDENGQVIFDAPFDFAQNFHLGTAIVKQNGKWGVTSIDTMIIEPRYAKIERVAAFSDTIFKVKLDRPGTRFMDTLTNDLPLTVSRVLKSTNHFSIVQSGPLMQVLDNDYNILSPEGKSYRLLGDNAYYERDKKEYMVYSANGGHIVNTSAKPEQILLDEYVVFKKGSKYGLLDASGDTLLQPDYKSIEEQGRYILATGSSGGILITQDSRVLAETESGSVVADPISGNYAVTKGNATKVYTPQEKRIATFKGLYPDRFIGGVLMRTGRDSKLETVDKNAKQPELPGRIDAIDYYEGFGILVDSSSVLRYFDENWNVLNGGKNLERGKYLGEGVVKARSDSGVVLVSPDTVVYFERGTEFDRSFSDGTLLVKRLTRNWYLNADLEELFDRKFQEASPFEHGYAAVRETGGWTIIDKRGYQKSLNSYGKISVLGNNLFSTSKPAHFGLITQSGKTILPAEFERITILDKTLIQAVKEGEIYYFTQDGTPIEY